MSDELAFVEQVRLHPHDDAPRLIYADYLEDAGDPQGELIRVQVELASAPQGDVRRVELAQRETELLEEFGDDWLAPLRELGAEGVNIRCFQRGLIERVRIQADKFVKTGEELCRLAPALFHLELRNAGKLAWRLATTHLPPQITLVDLSSNALNSSHVEALVHAPWLSQIDALNLQFNALGDEGCRQLRACEIPKLRELYLGVNRMGADGAAALAAWPSLAGVRTLSLRVNPLGDAGITRLARSENLGKLESLDLASCEIQAAGAKALAGAHLPKLKQLNLRANNIKSAETVLANASWHGKVKDLDLRGN